ncbi:MAG TPA: ABC transporter substrate-binding protein [Solirubrobacteraceae bacterium]|nr:ABC transporter substrate-binding protein [Solirubrobacteraceae bacterium]
MRHGPRIGSLRLAGASCALLLAAAAPSASGAHIRANSFLGEIQSTEAQSLGCASVGGALTVLQEEPYEALDPGSAYSATAFTVVNATQRSLYTYSPDTVTEAVPDVAEGPPEISASGRLVTVHLKAGIDFSPPVDREVTSQDVAYAIERGASPHVDNPYFREYFGSIEGASKARGGPIRGIQTPTAHEIVFRLVRPLGDLVAKALVMPLTAPVPKSYAEGFDRHDPSTYESHEVATGPYMIQNNAAGKVLGVGYRPGHSLVLVRNPNWDAASDPRPACLGEIKVVISEEAPTEFALDPLKGSDTVDAARSSFAEYDLTHFTSQVVTSPGAGESYVALDVRTWPFRDELVRKALYAALDRAELNAISGPGSFFQRTATHFLDPGIPGFAQAGAYAGPKGARFAFGEHERGDLALARKYLRRAGYRHGRYGGRRRITVGGSLLLREEVSETLRALGFKVRAAQAGYCAEPRREVSACLTGWDPDFGDAQAVLGLPFDGERITATENFNQGQVDVPWLDRQMRRAEEIGVEPQRAGAWARIDDELVEHAFAIPLDWETAARLEASDVHGVADRWNSGNWDYSYTSLK